jgi:transcriptional regulator GlxA family with amidase domain
MERQFRNVLNETPSRYYKGLRLEKARSLLFETDLSVTEVAVACGFNSANAFSKSYRAQFGTSPAQQAARGQ